MGEASKTGRHGRDARLGGSGPLMCASKQEARVFLEQRGQASLSSQAAGELGRAGPARSVLTTKYHRPGGFATESYLLMALEAGSPRIRWWQGWFPEAALTGLQSAASSLCPPVVFSLSTCVPAGSLCVLISSSYKDTRQSAHPNGHPNCLPQRPSL